MKKTIIENPLINVDRLKRYTNNLKRYNYFENWIFNADGEQILKRVNVLEENKNRKA